MKCEHAVVILTSELLMFIAIASGTICYGAQFSEDVWPCADFDNQMLKCDSLHLGTVEGKEGELGLNGNITALKAIEEGVQMHVDIWKILDIGKEFLYHVEGDMCESLKQEDAVWYPMIKAMKITECPIAADNYPVKDMVINLNHIKDMMTHEFCGDYLMELAMTYGEDLEKQSCYEIGVAVNEFEC